MDHLAEAEKELDSSFNLSPQAPEATLAILAAQAHALIAIGHALETLADCTTESPQFSHRSTLHIFSDHAEEHYR